MSEEKKRSKGRKGDGGHQDHTAILENGSFWSLILRLSLPAMVVILVMILYNMADTYFIGQTGDPAKITAISLSMPIFTILSGFGTLLGNGGSTVLSIAYGEKNHHKIKQISAFCIGGSLIIGIIFLALLMGFTEGIANILGANEDTLHHTVVYLRVFAVASPMVLFSQSFAQLIRADGDGATAMIASLGGTVANIVLDALFILGFHWDVMGAALATVIGNMLNSLILILVIMKKKRILIPDKDGWKIPSALMGQVIALGMPMACSTLLNSVSHTMQNRLMIAHSTTAVAAQSVSGKIGMMVTMLIMGVCMGMQPAISYNFGAGNLKRMYQVLKDTLAFSVGLGLILSVGAFFAKDALVAAFIHNDEVIAMGSTFVLAAVCVGPFYGAYQMCQTFLQGTGKASYAIFVSLLDKGLIFIPMMFLMDHFWGPYGLAFAHSATMVFSLIIGIFLSARWAKAMGKA